MAITIRDLKAPRNASPRQRNIASLVGGYIIALGCLVLFLLVVSEFTPLTWPVVLAGVALAGVVGVWVRVADL